MIGDLRCWMVERRERMDEWMMMSGMIASLWQRHRRFILFPRPFEIPNRDRCVEPSDVEVDMTMPHGRPATQPRAIPRCPDLTGRSRSTVWISTSALSAASST